MNKKKSSGSHNTRRLTSGTSDIDDWIAAHPEFRAQAERIGRLHRRERRDALTIGAMASRCLKRYDRELNPAKLAQALTIVTGTKYSRENINNYRDAFRMYRLWKQKCGNRPPLLEASKLAKAWHSGRGHLNDDDRVELCQRTAEKGLTRSEMENESLRISREKSRAQLIYDVVPKVEHVRCMDGLALLQAQTNESVDVVLLDYMYKGYMGADNRPWPSGLLAVWLDFALAAISNSPRPPTPKCQGTPVSTSQATACPPCHP